MKKASFSKIIDGFKASVLLAGIYVFIFAVIVLSGPGVHNFFHLDQWKYHGVGKTFKGTIILGLVLGYCFPKIARKVCSPIFVTFSAALSVFGCLYFILASHDSSPQDMKLADCTNATVNVHFTAPPGHDYSLDLRCSGITQMPNGTAVCSYKFSGRIRISNGTTVVADAPINTDTSFAAYPDLILMGGWRQPKALSSIQFMRPDKGYDLQIQFNPPPPAGSSIWLYWMENAAERDE